MKLYKYRDQDDYIKELSNDNVINIIGLKGSGKSTNSYKFLNDNKYLVINTDRLYDLPCEDINNNDIDKVKEFLINKYGEIKNNIVFKDYYNSIIEFSSLRNKILVIEGNSLLDMDISNLRGTLIVKRTAVKKCYKRAVKRDYNNKYFMEEEKKKHKYLYRLTRYINISKRRKKIFKEAKDLEELLDKIK